MFIVMEYMEHGDLDSHLKRPLPENEAREITLQITEGLKSLHENGFAHRDLKPAVEQLLSKKERMFANKSRISLSFAKALIGGSKSVTLASANASMRKAAFNHRLEHRLSLPQKCRCFISLA